MSGRIDALAMMPWKLMPWKTQPTYTARLQNEPADPLPLHFVTRRIGFLINKIICLLPLRTSLLLAMGFLSLAI